MENQLQHYDDAKKIESEIKELEDSQKFLDMEGREIQRRMYEKRTLLPAIRNQAAEYAFKKLSIEFDIALKRGASFQQLEGMAANFARNVKAMLDAPEFVDEDNWLEQFKTHSDKGPIILEAPATFGIAEKDPIGFPYGHLSIVAAFAGGGKTRHVCSIVRDLAMAGKKILFITLEMSKIEIAGVITLQQHRRLTGDSISWARWMKMHTPAHPDATKPLQNIQIEASNTRMIEDIKRAFTHYEMHFDCEPDMVVVDYVQKIKGNPEFRTRKDQIDHTIRELDAMAKNSSSAWVLASQLNRASMSEKPSLAHLKESGQLEEHAGAVWLLDKLKTEGKSINYELHIAKNRFGPIVKDHIYHVDGPTGMVIGRHVPAESVYEYNENAVKLPAHPGGAKQWA